MNASHLTDQEFKELVIKVAIKIAPKIIENSKNGDIAADAVATYSYHIAEAVSSILKDPSGSGL